MRNLKKILALVLALMMTLSLMVTASATSYKDDDSIQYDEAVTVMSAIGVFNGTGGGNFSPNGTLKRDQAAKIIAFMVLGKGADELPNDAATFSDVGKYWGAGPIAWCASEGIVNGVGDNKFSPNREVTGYEFGKMLLNAAGIEGKYTGGNWQINVAAALSKNNITTGMTGLTLSKPLTREQACQMAFKAIQVSPNGSSSVFVVTRNSDGAVIYRGTDALQALALSSAGGGSYSLSIANTYDGSLSDVVFNLENVLVPDAFGRNMSTWRDQDTQIAIYQSSANVTKTYTTATTYDKIAADLGGKAGVQFTFNVSVNGATPTEVKAAKGTTTAFNESGNGVLVEVYQTGDTTADIFVINTYAAEIQTVNAAVAATDTPANIELPNPKGGTALTYDTTAFKEGDVVLYTVTDAGDVVTVEKAPYVSGTVSAHSTANGYIRVNGGSPMYKGAKCETATIGTTAGYTYGSPAYTYYLDNYGYIMLAKVGQTAQPDVNYTYLISYAAVAGGTSSGALYGDSTSTNAAAKAQVMDLSTGKISVVNLAVVKGADNKWYYATASGSASTTPVATTNTDPTSKDGTPVAVNKIMSYSTLADGSYVINATPAGAASASSIAMTKGDAKITGSSILAGSATKITVLTYTNGYASVTKDEYTGIAGLPATGIAAGATDVLLLNNTANVATEIVFVKPAAPVTALPDYAIFAGAGETSSDGSAYAFYVDGKKVDYYLAAGSAADATKTALGKLTEGEVVTVALTGGKLTDVSGASCVNKAAAAVGTGKVTVVDSTYVAIGSNVFYFADGCQTVNAKTGALATVKVGDTVALYGEDANNIAFIVITG